MNTTKNKKTSDDLKSWLEKFNKKYKKGLFELATHNETIFIGKRVLEKHLRAFKELAKK